MDVPVTASIMTGGNSCRRDHQQGTGTDIRPEPASCGGFIPGYIYRNLSYQSRIPDLQRRNVHSGLLEDRNERAPGPILCPGAHVPRPPPLHEPGWLDNAATSRLPGSLNGTLDRTRSQARSHEHRASEILVPGPGMQGVVSWNALQTGLGRGLCSGG